MIPNTWRTEEEIAQCATRHARGDFKFAPNIETS